MYELAAMPGADTETAVIETAVIGDSYAIFLWFCSQVDPAFSEGWVQAETLNDD